MTGKNLNVRVTDTSVIIDGYVNAVERKSKLLNSRIGKFYEKIRAGVFAEALKNNKDVKLYLNHDPSVEYATTKDGSIELEEDSIGLKAHAELTDPTIVEKARNNELVGWSFGFYDVDGGYELNWDTESDYPTRTVNEMELVEVSLLDTNNTPAYAGTLVSVRNEEGKAMSIGGEQDEQEESEDSESKEEQTPEQNAEVQPEQTPEASPEETPQEEPKEEEQEEAPQELVNNSVDLSEYRKLITAMRED